MAVNATTAPAGTQAVGVAGTAAAFEPGQEPGSLPSTIEHEEIARLAYSHWEARGCPYGSPEADWFRAERELQAKVSAAAA